MPGRLGKLARSGIATICGKNRDVCARPHEAEPTSGLYNFGLPIEAKTNAPKNITSHSSFIRLSECS